MTGDPEPHYNPIFERFVNVDQPDPDKLPGMVAYCLYKVAKREWATDFFRREGRKPNDDELSAYIRTWTPTRLDGAQQQAESVLLSFANSVIEANTAQIREDALRGRFWGAVGTAIFAAFLYTLLLIGAVVISQLAGVDVVSIFSSLSAG